MAISPEFFVCFQWEPQIWKEQSFSLTTGMEGITQLHKSKFEWSKCKWRHQCHAFVKKRAFFKICPVLTDTNSMQIKLDAFANVVKDKTF